MSEDGTAPSQDRFERNMAWLRDAAPQVHDRLAALTHPAGRIVADPQTPSDLNFLADGRLFFDGGVASQARRDVEAFLAAPEKVSWPPLVSDYGSPVVGPMRRRIDAFVQRAGLRSDTPPAHHCGAALIAFGVGLGGHLARLIEAREFRHVVAVEPIADFLWHSLWLQDWAAWDARLKERRGTLKLVLKDDAEDIVNQAHWHLADHCLRTIDGTYIQQAYRSELLDRCRQALRARLFSVRNEGFFEDEILMLTNATRNLASPGVKLVTNARAPARPLPAVLVGAGPSLDGALPHLARLRDRAIFFSAGTALGTLMRAGLAPDFHCEIENTEENYKGVAAVAAAHDLSGVTLIGSATVDPRMPALFGDRVLYLRDANMSSALYGDAATTIQGTSPNCMTLALRMAAGMGFGDVYLFGADFGARHPRKHHVSDSIWMTDPQWIARYERIADSMTIELPGNFGGKVYTNKLLQLFLTHAQALIQASEGVTFHNCSDGARIRGTIPRVAARVEPGMPPRSPAAVKAEIVATTRSSQPHSLAEPARLRDFGRTCRLWASDLLAALARLRDEGGDLIAWHDAIFGSLAAPAAGDPDAPARRILFEGSLALVFRHAFHYALRNPVAADPAFLAEVHDGFAETIAAMLDQLDRAIAGATSPTTVQAPPG